MTWQIQAEQYTSGAYTCSACSSPPLISFSACVSPSVGLSPSEPWSRFRGSSLHSPCVALPSPLAPAGAVVRGQVRNWDAQRGVFELAFDNGSVELAYLPQPSVNIVDARGTVLNWETFFLYCRSVGM